MKKTFIIDGSNAIRTWLHRKGKMNFQEENKCSSIFLKALPAFCQQHNCQVEVYFDGPKRVLDGAKDITVLFAHKKCADDLIVNSVYDIIENYKGQVCVATQDKNLIGRCRAYGAEVMHVWHLFTQIKQNILQYS